jgi:hypothetical protein
MARHLRQYGTATATAPVVEDPKNRLDILYLAVLDRFFAMHGQALVWNLYRARVAAFLQSNLGPLEYTARTSGPAASLMQGVDTWIDNSNEILLRGMWGRYRPMVEAFLAQEFPDAG